MLPLLILSGLLVGIGTTDHLSAEDSVAPQEALVPGIIDFGS